MLAAFFLTRRLMLQAWRLSCPPYNSRGTLKEPCYFRHRVSPLAKRVAGCGWETYVGTGELPKQICGYLSRHSFLPSHSCWSFFLLYLFSLFFIFYFKKRQGPWCHEDLLYDNINTSDHNGLSRLTHLMPLILHVVPLR